MKQIQNLMSIIGKSNQILSLQYELVENLFNQWGDLASGKRDEDLEQRAKQLNNEINRLCDEVEEEKKLYNCQFDAAI